MNGLVVSPAAAFRELDRDRCFGLVGEREAALRALIKEGVRGVLASERERWREGVLG